MQIIVAVDCDYSLRGGRGYGCTGPDGRIDFRIVCRVVPVVPGVLEHGKPGPDVVELVGDAGWVENGNHGLAVYIGLED